MKNVLIAVLKSKWLYIAIVSLGGLAGFSSESVRAVIMTLLGME